jgi:hypothetical protein
MVSLDEARGLWARGLSVVPVPAPGPQGDGKVPAIAWKAYQQRRATEAELSAWFAAGDQNLGVVTGAVSGVVVLDADSPEALAWLTRHVPYTPWQTKTARGFHLFYRHPGGRVPNRSKVRVATGRLAVDVRGDGGYVIGPGSTHRSGARYQWAGDWRETRAALPVYSAAWLPAACLVPVARPPVASSSDAVTRARAYLARVPVPAIGQGSDQTTFALAARLVRGFALPESETVALLDAWAGDRPGWDVGWLARKVRAAVRYGTEPVGGRL